jgi:Protein of unknown function (DUF3313)
MRALQIGGSTMRTRGFVGIFLAGLLYTILGTGCSMASKLKAEPAPDSGFLENSDQMKENRARAPFHRFWVDPAYDKANFNSIYVAPVNTDYVLKASTWAKANPRNIKIKDDLKMIGEEFRETVVAKFEKSESNRFAMVGKDKVADDTMILELAITQLVPGKAFLGMIGLASWAAPGPGGIAAGVVASFADDGWMAIEGRVRDAKSGHVMAMFADREAAKTRIIDVEAATWYGHARESMNDWAEQFVVMANSPKEIQVEDSSAFTLMPW